MSSLKGIKDSIFFNSLPIPLAENKLGVAPPIKIDISFRD